MQSFEIGDWAVSPRIWSNSPSVSFSSTKMSARISCG